MALWAGLPLASIVAISLISTTLSFDSRNDEVWVSVSIADSEVSRNVDLVVEWAAPAEVLAPQWSGLVQRVDLLPGAPVVSGQSVVLIDGVTRLAAPTPLPFFRVIAAGTKGEDVRALNSLLNEWGYSSTQGDVVTRQTRSGIRQLAAAIGAGSTGAFDPGWLVFLPQNGFIAAEVLLKAGQSAPLIGSSIATAAPVPTTATVVLRDSVTVPRSDDVAISKPVRVDIPESVVVTAAAGETLRVQSSDLVLEDARTTVTKESLFELGPRLAPYQVIVRAQLARATAAGDLTMPTSAIVTDPQGNHCVYAGQGDPKWVKVDILTTVSGQAIVSAGVAPGDRVQIGADPKTARCS